jgi:hypothetical protein
VLPLAKHFAEPFLGHLTQLTFAAASESTRRVT